MQKFPPKAMRIPRIIHQTWKTAELPADLAALQATWQALHPHWQYRLWTDSDNRALIAEHEPWFLPIYDGYQQPICRVDAARYFILKHHGGVYIDLDFECVRPLDAALEGHGMVIGLEPQAHTELEHIRSHGVDVLLCPSFIACTSDHPFWAQVEKGLVQYHQTSDPLEATGPLLLSRLYQRLSNKSAVHLLPAEMLYPVSKFDCWDRLLNDPGFKAKVIAAPEVLGIHHWHGSWFRRESAPVAQLELQDPAPLALLKKGRIVLQAKLLQATLKSSEVQPLVSCLMVTRQRLAFAQRAIGCFQRQSWQNRELVIIDDDPNDGLALWVQTLGDAQIRLIKLAPDQRRLGTLRNLAVEAAHGDYVCQWDDDDLYDPTRLQWQMAALQTLAADVCFLQRWQLWWPQQPRLAISRSRVWEGSMLCRKAVLPAYPELERGEDTEVVAGLLQQQRVALLDQPALYTYVIHGQNTFDAEHFERHWQLASLQYSTREYDSIMAQLRARLQLPALGIQMPDSPIEAAPLPSILILTPLKNARAYLPRYVEKLLSLDYPSDRLSLALLESDSSDGSFEWLQQQRATLEKRFRKVQLIKRDFGFQLNDVRWARALQRQRRSVLAKSRNALLQAALGDEQFVLWLDIDVSDYPANVFQQLLATGKEIVLPHCVDGSGMTFDLNTFCFKDPAKGDSASALCDGLYQPSVGEGRWYLQDMREPLVKVDAVGGTMLLVNADLHRDGLNFPSFPYRHYIETEGLAMMAKDMGYSCWALRTLEIVHPRVA